MADIKKQVITREIIEKEIPLKLEKFKRLYIKHGLPSYLLIFSVCVFFTILFTIRKIDAISVFLILLTGLAFVFFVISIIGATCDYLRLKKAKKYCLYSLVIDCLKIKDGPVRNIINNGCCFHFIKYGLTEDLGSEFFKTTDVDVFDLAEQNDLFYMIIYKKRIICIYNTKFYELDEELQKKLRT